MMRQLMRWWVLLVLLMSVTVAQAAAPMGPTETPREAMLRYFNALNQGDTLRAFNTWWPGALNQSYGDYAAGFDNLIRSQPFFGELQVTAPNRGQLPTVLIAYETGSTPVRSFYGCYNLYYDGFTWRLTGSDMRVLSNDHALTNDDIASYLLTVDCGALLPPTGLPTSLAEMTGPHSQFMMGYFDAINTDQFSMAYAYWLSLLPDSAMPQDYRPVYADWVAGYADTRYINVYTGAYQYGGATAAKPYLDGMLPVALVAEHTDGSYTAYYGCFVLGQSSGVFGIVNGQLFEIADTVPDGATLAQATDIDCAALGIPN